MGAINTKKLVKEYKDIVAVNGIDLDIKEGELFSLLGVNGAGKTTTIKMLSTLIKPTSGTATVLGHDINKDSQQVKNIMNVSPQETAIAPNLTVKENLEFIASIYGISKKDISSSVSTMINLFNLNKIVNKRTKKLSGGWQRRLSIACALITKPNVLFLDEPTLGLDVIARRELWSIIESLKGKVTIILTTHYMEEAEMLSDRVAIMKDGNIIDVDTPKSLVKKTKTKNFEDAFVSLVVGGVK